ncbi:Tyrosine recombinase XerC [subsurface metagenome]
MKNQLNTLTPEECDKLLSYLMSPPENKAPPRVHQRNYTMTLLMLDAGLRVGELVQLRQDQLWFGDGPVKTLVIEKYQAKNKQERTVPITNRIHDATEQMHRNWWKDFTGRHPRYAFYATHRTMSLTTRQVQRIIKSASTLSIGREVHPHLLRHTFATRLMRNAPMPVLQELLGHKNLSSTQIYTHPNSEDRKKAIEAMNQNK